jgi:membrane protease subunit HflK
MRYLLWLLLGLVVLALLLSLRTSVTQVEPGEVAVVRRFGRVVDRVGPGLYVGLPWGLDRVDRVAVDLVRRVKIGFDRDGADAGDTVTPPGQMLTGDHNLVNVEVEVYYKVNEAEVEHYVLQEDRVDGVIARAAEALVAQWVAGRNVDEVLLRGKAALPRWLVEQAQRRVGPYGLGVTIQDAAVTYLNPPRDVQAAFDEVGQAQYQKDGKVYRAQQEAERSWRDAQADEFRIKRLTAAYVYEQQVLAQADAGSFEARLKQYQQLRRDNPDYLNALWWDEMSRLYARMRESGRIDLLDNRLSADGLDITQFPPLPRPKK